MDLELIPNGFLTKNFGKNPADYEMNRNCAVLNFENKSIYMPSLDIPEERTFWLYLRRGVKGFLLKKWDENKLR